MWCSRGSNLWHKTLALGCWRWRFWTFFPTKKLGIYKGWVRWVFLLGPVAYVQRRSVSFYGVYEMGHVETCGATFHPPKIFFVVDIHLPKMCTRDIFHQGKKQLHFSSYSSKKILGRQFISASYVSLNPSLPDFQIKGYINWSTLGGVTVIYPQKRIYIYKDSLRWVDLTIPT